MNDNYVIEPSKKVSVAGCYDVVVCGGGPAGICAAVAASRNGAHTLLIEKMGFLGGMATAGLVGPMSKFNFFGKRIIGGIPLEFVDRLKELNGAITDLETGNIPFDSELYKLIAQRIVCESGADIILHAMVVGCLMKDKETVSHVFVETKSGKKAIKAGCVIDCTGTGDFLQHTKFPWCMRSKKEDLQPLSLIFKLSGVNIDNIDLLMAKDTVRYFNTRLREALVKEKENGNIVNFGGPWALWGSSKRKGEISVNVSRISVDATDFKDLSFAEQQLREEIHKIVGIFKKSDRNFKNCYMVTSAPHIGIRETRGIEGLYTLTIDDILHPEPFSDTVALGGHPVDIHSSIDGKQRCDFLKKPYNIPFRCLVPKGSGNFMVAGGTISATREAFASVRVQGQCMATGQAAGTVAAVISREGIRIHDFDGSKLREILKKQGAIV